MCFFVFLRSKEGRITWEQWAHVCLGCFEIRINSYLKCVLIHTYLHTYINAYIHSYIDTFWNIQSLSFMHNSSSPFCLLPTLVYQFLHSHNTRRLAAFWCLVLEQRCVDEYEVTLLFWSKCMHPHCNTNSLSAAWSVIDQHYQAFWFLFVCFRFLLSQRKIIRIWRSRFVIAWRLFCLLCWRYSFNIHSS